MARAYTASEVKQASRAEIIRANPIVEFLQRRGIGLRERGGKFVTAACPLTQHKRNHFCVTVDPQKHLWHCNDDDIGGTVIDWLIHERNCTSADAIRILSRNGAVPSPQRQAPPFDWQKCVSAFTEKHIQHIAQWRGYSPEFVRELRDTSHIGIHRGLVAFPVHNNGKIVGAHYRLKSGDWAYAPTGIKAAPLIFGALDPGERINVFESTWDGLDYLDKSGERDGVIITRGAGNAKLALALIPRKSAAFLWTQNDEAGAKWQRDFVADVKCAVKRVKIPAHDLNDWTRNGASTDDLLGAVLNAEILREPERPLIEFRSPLQLRNFKPPAGIVLVGDYHIVKGNTYVIGGPPSVGKSRGADALAVAGATESDWFGLKVHRKFKTMIVQNENGEFRLSREFSELNCEVLENFVRISPPPPFGFCFARAEFRAQLTAAIAEFQPDTVIFDPWNAAAYEQDSREYLDTFDALKSVLPLGDSAPALGIVAHTRKPKTDERASGRGLLNLLAGSYVLGSVPRTVFVMQAASDDTTDNRIVWTCCKNNDGELGARSAWERRNGLFAPVRDFDWDSFDAPKEDSRSVITESDLAAIFESGALTKGEAVEQLKANTGAHPSSCYRALKVGGRFARHLRVENGKLTWKK
jgi:hypothetical protein